MNCGQENQVWLMLFGAKKSEMYNKKLLNIAVILAFYRKLNSKKRALHDGVPSQARAAGAADRSS